MTGHWHDTIRLWKIGQANEGKEFDSSDIEMNTASGKRNIQAWRLFWMVEIPGNTTMSRLHHSHFLLIRCIVGIGKMPANGISALCVIMGEHRVKLSGIVE